MNADGTLDTNETWEADAADLLSNTQGLDLRQDEGAAAAPRHRRVLLRYARHRQGGNRCFQAGDMHLRNVSSPYVDIWEQ
jgi:hypothetical protein